MPAWRFSKCTLLQQEHVRLFPGKLPLPLRKHRQDTPEFNRGERIPVYATIGGIQYYAGR